MHAVHLNHPSFIVPALKIDRQLHVFIVTDTNRMLGKKNGCEMFWRIFREEITVCSDVNGRYDDVNGRYDDVNGRYDEIRN